RINAMRIRLESIQAPFGLIAGIGSIPPALLIRINIAQSVCFTKRWGVFEEIPRRHPDGRRREGLVTKR
ncbi:MAG: hypothetical protein WBN03_11500, partial [Desulfobacterales bacterium]